VKDVEHKCIIGIIYNYENTALVTLAELKEYADQQKHIYDTAAEENKRFAPGKGYDLKRFRYTQLNDFFDMRRKTELNHFDYCPICGQKIDWKAMKEGIEKK